MAPIRIAPLAGSLLLLTLASAAVADDAFGP